MRQAIVHVFRTLLLLLLFGNATACAADYFVSPLGSDAGGDGSMGRPWQTIGYAIERVYPGDVLYLRAGEYHEQFMTFRDGTASAPITIAAFGLEQAIIDGGGVASGNNGCLVSHSYLKLRGFTVRNWAHDGIAIRDCAFLELKKLLVTAVGAGISMKGSVHDFLLDSCTMSEYYAGAGGYGFDATPEGPGDSIHSGTIQHCKAYISAGAFDNCDGFALGHDGVRNIRFHNCETYGIGDGFDISGVDILLTSCSAHDATYGGGYKLWRENVTLVNCIGYNNGVNLELDYDGGVNRGVHARLVNCTFHGCYDANIRIENTAGGSTLEMFNCILSGSDNTGLNFDGDSIRCYRGDFNLFHMNAPERAIATSQFDFSLAQIENGEWTAASGQDAHSRVVVDASELFADSARARPDLRLRAGSRAVDGGATVADAPAVDFDGTQRGDGKHDIGAFEYRGGTGVSDGAAGRSEGFTIGAIYPNPLVAAAGIITVVYQFPERASFTLTLCDATGRHLSLIASGSRDAGSHASCFDAGELPAGRYFCLLRSSTSVVARAVLVVR